MNRFSMRCPSFCCYPSGDVAEVSFDEDTDKLIEFGCRHCGTYLTEGDYLDWLDEYKAELEKWIKYIDKCRSEVGVGKSEV